MAKILCAISGIEFKCDHFPISLSQRECYHPLFCVPQKRLLSYTSKWAGGELTDTDSYLLFLALMNSTELVEFRVPAFITVHTPSIVAGNMESLIKIVGKINAVKHPDLTLPHFVVSPDTKDLTNVDNWIQMWHQSYAEFAEGYRTYSTSQEILRREVALERLIKNPLKSPESYAKTLSEWAAKVGDFPTFAIEVGNIRMPLAQYWKSIIIRCAKSESIFSIAEKDLDELIEHCEDNVPAGSIYAFNLFKLLRAGKERQKNFLGFGDYDITSNTSFHILDANASVEEANKLAMIAAAPKVMPRKQDYATLLQYLKAKANWDMAQKYLPPEAPETSPL